MEEAPSLKDVKADRVLYLVNGKEWSSDDSNDEDFVVKGQKVAKRKVRNKNLVLDTPPVPSSPVVGKFVIKRTSKDNGEDKFTFRRKRRSKNDRFGAAKPTVRKKGSGRKRARTTDTSNDEVEISTDIQAIPWFTIMPVEVLHIIFKMVIRTEGAVPFLERASEVCELWKMAADHSSLWTHIDLSKPKVTMTITELMTLSRTRFASSRELSLANWGLSLDATTIQTISEECPLLTSLNVSGCLRVTGSVLRHVVDKCPNLTSLDLSHVQAYGTGKDTVSGSSISYLASKLGSKIVHLNISGNVVRALRGILTIISEGFPHLRELDMSGCSTASRDAVLIPMEKLQQGCTKLKVLRLANIFDMRLASIPLTEQASSPGFPELEELSLAKSYDNFDVGLDEPSFERILKSSCKLRLLDVRGCSRITSSSLVRIPAWDLEHLFLSGCTGAVNSGLEIVFQKWAHSLVQVDLSWNNQSGESINLAVKALAESTSSESPLRMLDVCGSAVSFESVKAVLCNCPSLEVLNLSSCRGLPRGIKRAYDVDSIVKLKSDVEALKATELSSPPL